jgi:hypothetical protein
LSEKRQKNYRENSKEDPEASVESIIKKALKTYKIKFKKHSCMYKLCTFGLFCGSVALAQVNEQKQDTTKLVIL